MKYTVTFTIICLLALGGTAMHGMQPKKPIHREPSHIPQLKKLISSEPYRIPSGSTSEPTYTDETERGIEPSYLDPITAARFQATKEGRNPDEAELTVRIDMAKKAALKHGEDPDAAEKQVRDKFIEWKAFMKKILGDK
jgi:hypothetical protein